MYRSKLIIPASSIQRYFNCWFLSHNGIMKEQKESVSNSANVPFPRRTDSPLPVALPLSIVEPAGHHAICTRRLAGIQMAVGDLRTICCCLTRHPCVCTSALTAYKCRPRLVIVHCPQTSYPFMEAIISLMVVSGRHPIRVGIAVDLDPFK